MNINFSFNWDTLAMYYEPPLSGFEVEVNGFRNNLPSHPSEWHAGLLLVLPARLTQGTAIAELDVIGEVTEVIFLATPTSKDDLQVSIKILRPYSS